MTSLYNHCFRFVHNGVVGDSSLDTSFWILIKRMNIRAWGRRISCPVYQELNDCALTAPSLTSLKLYKSKFLSSHIFSLHIIIIEFMCIIEQLIGSVHYNMFPSLIECLQLMKIYRIKILTSTQLFHLIYLLWYDMICHACVMPYWFSWF